MSDWTKDHSDAMDHEPSVLLFRNFIEFFNKVIEIESFYGKKQSNQNYE